MSIILKNEATMPLSIPGNSYVVCTLHTQAAFQITVKIKDLNGNDLIAPMTRQNIEANPPIHRDFTMPSDDRCRLFIDIPASRNIDSRLTYVHFDTVDKITRVGTYVIICEDGGDRDYNDLFLTITFYP